MDNQIPQPCPTCGRCPTCGCYPEIAPVPAQPYPWILVYPYLDPTIYPTIYTTDSPQIKITW